MTLSVDGDRVAGTVGRMGVDIIEVSGRLTGSLDLPEDRTKTDWPSARACSEARS